jgi:hypothetical protein
MMNLTVFYDGQFWVGVIERTTEEGLFASRHIFGAEPRDEEILEFVLNDLGRIIDQQTVAVPIEKKRRKRVNPKRLAREAARQMKEEPVSSKSQAAIQAQYEANKQEKRVAKREQRQQAQEERWQKKQAKAKQRHRGK